MTTAQVPTDWFPLRVHEDDDHHGALRLKRNEAPVEHRPVYEGGEGPPMWVVYRYDDVRRVVDDQESMGTEIIDERYGAVLGDSFLTSAPTVRHAVRKAVADALPSSAELRELVGEVVDDALDGVQPGAEPLDVVPVTAPVAGRVLTRLLGLPDADAESITDLAAAAARFLSDPEAGVRAAARLEARFRAALSDGRPPPGLLRAIAEVDVGGRRLGEQEVLSSLSLLAWAGTETAFPGTITTLYALLSHPDELAAVRREPSLMPAAVEEAMRWESPVQITARSVRRPVEVGGQRLAAGDTVLAHLGSANRDDRRFAHPDAYDVRRSGLSHAVAFGHGPHRCLGRHLARIEMATFVERLLDRYPQIRLHPSSPPPQGQLVRCPRALLVELS